MTDVETKRGRVREMLIDPLVRSGMCFRRDVGADEARRKLDDLADQLAYMADAPLRALADSLRTKGEGSHRKFWPERITVLGLAEEFQRREIEELPGLVSWFGSIEGPRARDNGTLVPTFLFLREFKRPPVKGDADFRKVRINGMWWSELADEIRLARDRARRGMSRPDDGPMLEWVAGIEARAEALVQAGEAKRGDAA